MSISTVALSRFSLARPWRKKKQRSSAFKKPLEEKTREFTSLQILDKLRQIRIFSTFLGQARILHDDTSEVQNHKPQSYQRHPKAPAIACIRLAFGIDLDGGVRRAPRSGKTIGENEGCGFRLSITVRRGGGEGGGGWIRPLVYDNGSETVETPEKKTLSIYTQPPFFAVLQKYNHCKK